jgi:hypothetical protein
MTDKMFEQLSAELQKKTAAVDAAREALRLAEKDKADFLQTLESISKTAQNHTKATSASGSGKRTSGIDDDVFLKKDHKKQALSPYMLFCQAKRGEIKRANPGLSVPQMGATLGVAWRQLPQHEKNAYKAPLPAAPQSIVSGGAANDDAEMSDSKSEENEKSNKCTQQATPGSAPKQAASSSDDDHVSETESEGEGAAALPRCRADPRLIALRQPRCAGRAWQSLRTRACFASAINALNP